MYNKWILHPDYYGFTFPITLTMWHMAFSSVLAILCVKSGWIFPESGMTFEIYIWAILPVALLFAGERYRCQNLPHF